MAKKPTPISMQIQQFEKRLDESDELTKKLLLAIHGDENLDIKGLIPFVQEFSSKLEDVIKTVADIKRKQDQFEESRETIQIKKSVLIQRALATAGLIGILVSAFIGITQVIDWLYKQGILER